MFQPILIAALLAGAPQADGTFDEDEAAWSVVNIGFGSASAFTGGALLINLALSGAVGVAYWYWNAEGNPRQDDALALGLGAAAATPAALLGAALLGGGATLIYFGRVSLVEQLSRLEPKRLPPKRTKRRRRPGRRLD